MRTTGIVPERIGGTELGAPTAPVYGPSIEDQKKALAEVTAQLDAERTTKLPNSPLFSNNSLAERISALVKESEALDPKTGQPSSDALWAKSLVDKLKAAGIVTFSASAIERHIEKLLASDPRGVELENGCMLRYLVKVQGGAGRAKGNYKFERSGI